jgi:hypothetical protein
VNVDGTAGVVARENGLELDNALVVAWLDSTQEGSVEVGSIGRITVAAGNYAGVDTLS